MEENKKNFKKITQYLIVSCCIVIVAAFGFIRLNLSSFMGNSSVIGAMAQGGDISITKAATELRRGDIGFITISGVPGVRYTVSTTFSDRNTTRRVTQWRVADSSGIATFIWNVGSDTALGTYPITISGGGKTLNLYHTVTK